MNDEQEYVLGQDVTKAAESKNRSGSVMLSVRLSADELAAIEAMADASGKTLSQVVREAVRNCLQVAEKAQPIMTISVSGGMTMRTGAPRQAITVGYGVARNPDLTPL